MELLILLVVAVAGAGVYFLIRSGFAAQMPPPSAAERDSEANPVSKAQPLAMLRQKAIADLDIEYADADGVLTRREVLILSMDMDETLTGELQPTRFTAWCLLRQDERTFLVPRVQTIFRRGLPDLRTREEIDRHFQHIAADAQRRADVTVGPAKPRRRRH
jgi:predicted DNA-binding transcriptional regulator YafY